MILLILKTISLDPKKYLGKFDSDYSQPEPLELISSGSPLILKDANGLLHKSSKITIEWYQSPLKVPSNFVRQVIGPFASFESAKRISVLLDEDGITNTIAHPSDWEVWVPLSIKLPNGLKAKIIRETFSHEVKPVLKIASGKYLLSGVIEINAPDGLLWEKG